MTNVVDLKGEQVSSKKSPIAQVIATKNPLQDIPSPSEDLASQFRAHIEKIHDMRYERYANTLTSKLEYCFPALKKVFSAVRAPFLRLAYTALVHEATVQACSLTGCKTSARLHGSKKTKDERLRITIDTKLSKLENLFGSFTLDQMLSTPDVRNTYYAFNALKALNILDTAQQQDGDYTKKQSKIAEQLGEDYEKPVLHVGVLESFRRQRLWYALYDIAEECRREDFEVIPKRGEVFKHFDCGSVTIKPFGHSKFIDSIHIFENRDRNRVSAQELKAAISFIKSYSKLNETAYVPSALERKIYASLKKKGDK